MQTLARSGLLLLALCAIVMATCAKDRKHNPRKDDRNRLYEVCLSIHEYHDVHGVFPPAEYPGGPRVRDIHGRPYLSWRVHILPFVEQQELYRKFRLDEPWDSFHNKQLLTEMPRCYAINDNLGRGMSDIIAPFGNHTVLGSSAPRSFSDIADGSDLTIMLIEAAPQHAVPWTKPDDLDFDPTAANAMSQFGPPHGSTFLVGMANSFPIEIKRDVTPATLQSMIDINDGAPTSLEGIR